LTLDHLESYGAILTDSFSFGLTLDEAATISKITSNAETFGITVDEINTLNKITSGIQGFDLVLDESELNVKTTNASDTFNVNLDDSGSATADRSVSFSASIDLDQLEFGQVDRVVSYLESINLDNAQSNVKTSVGVVTFDTELTYNTLTQLAANLDITIGTDMDLQYTVDGAGIVEAAITFLSTMQQTPTNIMTASKAVDLIMEVDQQHGNQLDKLETLLLAIQASDGYVPSRSLPASVDFATELDQSQINTALRVGLMTFDTTLDKSNSTAGSTFGGTINFATALAEQFTTDGESFGNILYGITLNQDTSPEKSTLATMGFDIQADVITDIHLTVEGTINLSTVMDQTEFKQLTGQSEITFGHLQGLASLGSADFGADISFGTIQNAQVNGFVLQFEIVTPRGRTYKIYMEDRTVEVSDGRRTLDVNKT
jgi:hypothetical protein